MADEQHEPEFDVESGFSDEEKTEIRSYIDSLTSENRILPDEARFDGKSARSGVFFPLLVNVAAVAGILIGVLLLRSVFRQVERDVQNRAVEYSSVEGRLIRELRAESQALIIAKEQEIEQVRRQLEQLEGEQALLESEIDARIAEREAELRRELEHELTTERTRLIAEGLNSEEIDRLMEAFEQERSAYYEQQLAEFRAELETERVALQSEIDSLRAEYQVRLSELRRERQAIVDEFREREQDLRVELEQRTRVLEIARVEATADLEAAQRQLADLQRESADVQSIQNQIIGQIEQVQATIRSGDYALALARIDGLTAFLGQDRIIELEPLARRREIDLFLVSQLRSLVESRLTASGDVRSITQELRLLSRIRTLSEAAAGATSAEEARLAFDTLLATFPEVSVAHNQVVARARELAVDEIRIEERTTVERSAASAATLAAAGQYEAALNAYVAALDSLPAVAPDTNTIVGDVLRLGYALTDYVIDGERSPGLGAIARRATVDVDAERATLQTRIEAAVTAAVRAREAELQLDVAERSDRIEALDREIATLNAEPAAVGAPPLDEPSRAADRDSDDGRRLADRVSALEGETDRLATERDSLIVERGRLQAQRDQLVDERVRLRTRFAEYAQAQQRAIAGSDFVALADARDAFFLSSELELIMPGLSELIDRYDQQYAVEQQAIGLSAFQVNEIVEELGADLTQNQRRLLLENAIETARADGEATYAQFLTLLDEMLTAVAGAN